MYDLYWHINHDKLFDFLIEPPEYRIADIRNHKPKDEVTLRLQLMKPVKNLPKKLIEAGQKFIEADYKVYEVAQKLDETRYKRDGAEHKRDEARQEFGKVSLEILPEMEELHKIECPNCPWNGKTIFPEKEPI